MQKSIVPYLIYPLLLIFGYSFYFYFNRIMPYSLLSAVLSIGLFSTMFLIYEYLFPKYDEWKWNLREIAEDLIYYNLCVQVLIPLGLIFLYQKCLNYYFLDLWPNHLPTFIQLVILSLTGEFLFYFWHRFSHESSFFRGIHLVHHLPTKLYSLNTVRFHFLDKFIECHLTVILFIFLGAQLELIYLYYIFFTATGLVQHCNTEVKFGIFDYVFASAETHRLHHDSIEENTRINYANNLVLWDLIFNTFKRIQSSPKLIGVKKFYPNGVLFETLFPFKMIYNQLEKSIIKVKMEKQKIDSLKPFLEKISNFKSIQENLLLSIINKNAKTLYGKKYQFENILSIKDFKKNVPLIEYEKIRDEMDQVISGKSNVLTKSQVIYFNKTSGTLGKPKYLPVTQEVLEDYKRIQKIISSCAYEYCPDGFNGLIFSVVGKAHEEKLNEQFYAGAMSGKTNSLTPTIVKKRYAITDEILNIEPLEKRNLYLAAIALLCPHISVYISPNPSTFLKILETINSLKAEISKLIQSNDPVLNRFKAKKESALKLLKKEQIALQDFWPNLKLVIMWTHGSCSYLLPKVKEILPEHVNVFELGYLSSEFHGTICLDPKNDIEIPIVDSHFYEFIAVNDFEDLNSFDRTSTLSLDQLEMDQEYYIIITTQSGLYRYFMNDIVLVNKHYLKCPSLIFQRKGKGMTNITGEKLSENQIVEFFKNHPKYKKIILFHKCLAYTKNSEEQYYRLFFEADIDSNISIKDLEDSLDTYLKNQNIEFKSKRESGRLKKIECLELVGGTKDEYINYLLKKGQRESQLKYLMLDYSHFEDFNFLQNSKTGKKNG